MIVHAVGESCVERHPPGTYAVVVQYHDLDTLVARLAGGGIDHHVVTDPDAGDGPLAIGIKPGPRSQIYPYVSSLPLYGKEGSK